jgi:hypothetical protein
LYGPIAMTALVLERLREGWGRQRDEAFAEAARRPSNG